VTWTLIIIFGAVTFLTRLAGLIVPQERLPHWFTSFAKVLPGAVLGALIAVQTFGGPERILTVDARLLGVGIAAILALRGLPLGVVILASMAVTALARALLGFA
jgi:branched-subunit amino acid transport protein